MARGGIGLQKDTSSSTGELTRQKAGRSRKGKPYYSLRPRWRCTDCASSLHAAAAAVDDWCRLPTCTDRVQLLYLYFAPLAPDAPIRTRALHMEESFLSAHRLEFVLLFDIKSILPKIWSQSSALQDASLTFKMRKYNVRHSLHILSSSLISMLIAET